MKRLFAFGCSFTQHSWPMWPTFFVNNFDQVYNYGRGGAGNGYIYHSVIEAVERYNINENDAVVIVWSGYSRVDILNNSKGWKTLGNIYYQYDPETIDKLWSIETSVLTTWNNMYLLSEFLKSKNIKFCYSSMCNMEFDEVMSKHTPRFSSMQSLIPGYLKDFKNSKIFTEMSFTDFQRKYYLIEGQQLYNIQRSIFGKIEKDGHPRVIINYNFAKQQISKTLGIELDSEMESFAHDLDDQLSRAIIVPGKCSEDISIEPFDNTKNFGWTVIDKSTLGRMMTAAKEFKTR